MRLEHKDRFAGYPARAWHRWVLGLMLTMGVGASRAQTVSFNLSATSSTWPGWTNVAGDPSVAVQSVTANGITLSSVATANWSPYSGYSAQNGSGYYPGYYFPPRVMSNNWFQYNGTGRSLALYNSLVPQIELSGLNPDSTYILRISGSDGGGFNTDPTQYTVAGKTNYGTQNLNVHNDSTQGVVFQGITPDSTGTIRLYVNATTSTDLAAICGIQVYPGYYGVGSPGVTISAPANGAIVAEGDNVSIRATAVEVADTIAKVEFYADTTKIGEVDTTPYNFTWISPEPGVYTITVKATDNEGTVGSASVYIGIKSLNYFWSTTGNIGNNADSTFAGNVDSMRLDFRTKDIQRMSISATGNIGIGTISPTTQLHVTGSVRLAGLINDSGSVYPRLLVSDTNGNLVYRSATDLGLVAGGGLGVTNSGILMLGDSVAGPGAHNFTANRYQNLNGYYYSIGGSVHNPVVRPDFRWYNNGDFVTGTTMDTSVSTEDTAGVRYYSKLGVLEIGASDRLDTTRSRIVTGSWQGSGVHINSSISNSGDPKMINTLLLSYSAIIDTSVVIMNSLLPTAGLGIYNPGSLRNSLHVGGYAVLSAPVSNSIIGGYEGIDVVTTAALVIGANIQEDTTEYSTITGFENSFGAPGQLVSGGFLRNRTPFGTAFGLNNVDFATLPYTGTKGMATTGIAGYPLLAIGNSALAADTQSTNALTILYNGRTQINTAGYGSGLTQTAATPKAALEVVSTNSGVLFPLLTVAQQSAIASTDLQTGLLLYNSDAGCYQFYNGTNWQSLGVSGSLAGEWQSLGNTGTSPASNFVGTTNAEPLIFRTNNSQWMTITTNGAVGIGTSTPQTNARLAVNGTIYAQKIEATQTGWPDYVFERGYSLMPLPGLQRYIQQHRRLPGVLSAKEAAETGVDLGDNQAQLLQKVEELTLYLIEAHKKAAERQKEIDRLTAAAAGLTTSNGSWRL